MGKSIFSEFTSLYSLTKTLRFELKPVEGTKSLKEVIEQDKKIDKYYNEEMKPMFDKLHEKFINESLHEVNLPIEYIEKLYHFFLELRSLNKDKKKNLDKILKIEGEKGEMVLLQKKLRVSVVDCFDQFAKKWQEDFLKEISFKKNNHEFLKEESVLDLLMALFPEKESIIKEFKGFFTYFSGFNQNRENYYSSDAKATSIANRIVNENLYRFFDNCFKYREFLANNAVFLDFGSIFELSFFNKCLSQKNIENYNNVIGELNKSVNLYSQKNPGIFKTTLKFKELYKQIGCGKKKLEIFEIVKGKEWDLLSSLFENQLGKSGEFLLEKGQKFYENFFKNIDRFDLNKIYFNKSSLNTISDLWFANWHKLSDVLRESGILKKDKNYKLNGESSIPREISLFELKEALLNQTEVESIFKEGVVYEGETVGRYRLLFKSNAWDTMISIWKFEIERNIDIIKKLYLQFGEKKQKSFDIKNDTKFVKEVCDAFLGFERMVKYHKVIDTNETDDLFYDFIDQYFERSVLLKYYNAFRNYLTKKPYSKEKIKLNFGSGHLLSGWSRDFGTYSALIFKKDSEYFFGIVNGTKFSEEELKSLYGNVEEEKQAERLVYWVQKIDNKNPPRWFIRSKKTNFAPLVREGVLDPSSIIDIYDKKLYSKSDNKLEYRRYLPKLLDYFKEGFLKHPDFINFRDNFIWNNSNDYDSVVEFYEHTANMCYKIDWEKINFDGLLELSKNNRIFLFKIHNKDFSKYSTGQKNLHSLLFLELLKKENVLSLKLLGNGEIFFREKSIDKNLKINKKSHKVFVNNRFTEDRVFLHFPVEIKSKNKPKRINELISNSNNVNILGIDRGEKHLLYYSLVDSNGKLLKQGSFNKIKCGDKIVDYHDLLSKRAEAMKDARVDWATIGSIKELKEGYLSQVVHEIYKLVLDNNAIIVLEDLNSEFKAKRTAKVEKSVYKKFELALARKLNHLILKDKKTLDEGGVLNAYQLTPPINAGDVSKFEKAKQWGIMFYVRANYTSTTDPLTGWRKTIYISNSDSIDVAKKKWKDSKINISFDSDKNCFVFSYDKWSLFSYEGLERLYWNRDEKNLEGKMGVMKRYNLFEEFNKLFAEVEGNINDFIFKSDKFSWKSFIFFWNLLNQIRNSDKNRVGDDSDFIQSPVWSEKHKMFFDSRKIQNENLPKNGDANGAYNIARKGLMLLDRINEKPEKPDLFISDVQWDGFAQNNGGVL